MQHFGRLIVFFVAAFAFHAQAESFCFASASTYYEQIYCELQTKGEAKNLPPFYQFKRNDQTTQALLLKRPARRIGIDLPMPKTNRISVPGAKIAEQQRPLMPPPAPVTNSPAKAATAKPGIKSQTPSLAGQLNCLFSAEEIRCGKRNFKLTGNLRNQRLAPNALDADNKMSLPVYHGSNTDTAAANAYISLTYRRYIEQMHAIGLGGVTMTYDKFYFLFFDLQDKGLDFSQRFETMYTFLKKDKAAMGISEKLTPDAQLTLTDCNPLSEQMLVCSRAGRNYLYLAVSE